MISKIKKIIWFILKKVRVLVIYKFFKKTTYGVRTIVTDDKKIFLVKHPYDNFWVLPGGGKKESESDFDVAKRETEEEAGLVVSGELKILGKYFNNKENKDDYVSIVIAKEWEKTIKKRRLIDKIEIQKRDWFDFDSLPKISLATQSRINEYLENDFTKEIRAW
jgi:8-oxo-dGTP pyrophosphatase MutT (NUDIX family)